MSQLGSQIKDELENFGLDTPEDDVMTKLTGLCSDLAIKPSDFADQWMAFSINNWLVKFIVNILVAIFQLILERIFFN